MHSPDRRYWWDGSNWRLAVSADGRLWFDGREWIPNPLRPPVGRRVPTKWTRPLQWFVVVVAALATGLFVATVPYVLSVISAMPPPVVVTPEGVPPPGTDQMARSVRLIEVLSIVVEMFIALGLLALVVVGALKRWAWAFWLALVLNGFSILGIALSAVFGLLAVIGVGMPQPPGAAPVQVPPEPAALQVTGWFLNAVEVLTFVAMLVALIRIGPWACRYETAEDFGRPPDRSPITSAPWSPA